MARHSISPRRTVTVAEAASILGIGRNSAYEAAKRGEIPTIKIGRLVLIPLDGLDRLLLGDRSGKGPIIAQR
jgi:excisionase family DNA binding protein